MTENALMLDNQKTLKSKQLPTFVSKEFQKEIEAERKRLDISILFDKKLEDTTKMIFDTCSEMLNRKNATAANFRYTGLKRRVESHAA